MNKISRRALARYAANELLAGKPAQTVAKHLAAAMVEAGKTDSVEFLLGDIAAELEARRELSVALVTSASELSPQLRVALKNQIKSATRSRSVLLQERIDQSVLGGIRVETPSHVWDHTVDRKLTDLKETF
ncbi:F0F1 ATP synthase subunit delta [Candidatus Saccharibacteria bacterium]|nr:F0F1 ATP synthase subunit delta [Candidatus Saccharibacteria bacterium]